MAENHESCSDERASEIILKGDLGAFNREYWLPELKKYQGRHERVLESLRRAIRHHLKGSFSDNEFCDGDDNMWYNSFDCTHHQKSEEFYHVFKDEVCRHVKINILPEFKRIKEMNILKNLVSTWTTYKATICLFSEVFKHLSLWIEDVPEDETPMDGIEVIGLNAFKNEIVLEEEIFEKLTSVLKKTTDERRNGIDVDCNSIKTVFELLVEMSCYQKIFEDNYLQRAEKYFEKVASENLKTMSTYEYVIEVEILISKEMESNGIYGNASTTRKVTEKLEKVLIKDHLQAIVYKEECGGVPKMLTEKAEDQLKSVYLTIKRVDGGLELLKNCLRNFISEQRKNIVKDFDRKLSVEYIEKFIQLKKTCNKFLLKSFDSNHDFACFIDAKFSKVVSDKQIVESLSIFIDKKFRFIKNDDVNEICDDFMMIFKEIEEKEFFKIVFNKHLCKRIVDSKNFLLENEKIIIEKLKAQCGYNYTVKLDTIIKDVELSEIRLKNFKSQYNNVPVIDIKVLMSTVWPFKVCEPIKMPPCILESYKNFSDFYIEASTKKKKLSLQISHGNATVLDYVAGKVNRTLEVNNHQLVVILMFNRQEQWTVQDLSDECNIPINYLKNVLKSLAFGKKQTQVLAKVSSGNEILPTDSFKVIENCSKQRKVKIPMIRSKEEEKKESNQSLDTFQLSRKCLLEAAIVRVMKSNKTLEHNVLITEVIKQVQGRCSVEVGQIKKCIESLIEKEYLERDSDCNSKYKYMS